MPELPEVETVKNGLAPVWLNQTIRRVELRRENLRYPFKPDFKETLEGARVTQMSRRGKYMIVSLNKGQHLIIHLGMSGSFKIEGSLYVPVKHDHVLFYLSNDKTLIYNDPRRFGFMVLVEDIEVYPPFKIMGPDPLGNDFNAPYLKRKFKTLETPIKTALLNQSLIAGIGNIYACEALHMAGISPLKPVQKISLSKLELLTQSIRDVLFKAIEVGGSSLKDHRQADGSLGYFQHQFTVYGRENALCLTCKRETNHIKRIVQAGRSTFYCPHCQR
ncbi:MAG: DNA-formamidopyrimidine glycosylase [Micavibrio sp.]|nr:DNA-formamidopyrimidine glycosylase [Micavibrio sp.]